MDPSQLIVGLVVAVVVIAFVAWPMLRRDRPAGAHTVDTERVERRILEYREALRRRTVCEGCLYANAEASRFCAQCGSRLPASDAQSGVTSSS